MNGLENKIWSKRESSRRNANAGWKMFTKNRMIVSKAADKSRRVRQVTCWWFIALMIWPWTRRVVLVKWCIYRCRLERIEYNTLSHDRCINTLLRCFCPTLYERSKEFKTHKCPWAFMKPMLKHSTLINALGHLWVCAMCALMCNAAALPLDIIDVMIL